MEKGFLLFWGSQVVAVHTCSLQLCVPRKCQHLPTALSEILDLYLTISPILAFPTNYLRKLSAQDNDVLSVSSSLSGAESSEVGIILLLNFCCMFTGVVHRTKIVLALWDRFLDLYNILFLLLID